MAQFYQQAEICGIIPTMTELEQAIELLKKLSAEEKTELLERLVGVSRGATQSKEDYLTEKRFADGVKCPHCDGKHIQRNGKARGYQQYICVDCRKYFSVTTNTIISCTKLPLEKWKKYVECMMANLSIRKSAEICGINRNTAFLWRHKILDALQNMAESVVLSGIVEGDETFFPLSYKGSHALPEGREARHHGQKNHKRGVSKEQVCVPCAVNRRGLSVAKATNLGHVSSENLKTAFAGRIEEGATFCSDGASQYVNFAISERLDLLQFKQKEGRSGLYNIQHINSYHSALKNFMRKFKGVSTKYLPNYLVWNNFENYANETFAEKHRILLEFIVTTKKKVLRKSYHQRPGLPFSVA